MHIEEKFDLGQPLDLSLINAGDGYLQLEGNVAIMMLRDVLFVLAWLTKPGNGLCYDSKTNECFGFRIQATEYERLLDLAPKTIGDHQKETLQIVMQRPQSAQLRDGKTRKSPSLKWLNLLSDSSCFMREERK